MGVSEKLHQTDGGHVVDSQKWVFSGIAMRGPLNPVLTKVPLEKKDAEEDEEVAECNFSTTPTYAESRIPSRLICPPAPKKRKPASSKSCRVREFFNPPDLETIFARRVDRRGLI